MAIADPNRLPRWLSPRAGRLAAALVEASIDAVGHRATLMRLADPQHALALGALCGLPLEVAPRLHTLAAALARGLDKDRLGLSAEDGAAPLIKSGPATVPLGGPGADILPLPVEPPKSLNEGNGRVILFPRRPALAPPRVDAFELGAAVHAAVVPLPAPFDRIAAEPGYGARTLRALALCARWVASGGPAHAGQLYFALGEVDGRPHGVPLAVYDRVIVALERMLHRPATDRSRVTPLLSLAAELEALRGRVPPASEDRLIAREGQRARDWLLVRRWQAVSPPRLPRRPIRRATRDPLTFQPIDECARPLSALDGQGDLFGP